MPAQRAPQAGPDSIKAAENIRMIMARDRVTLRDLSAKLADTDRPISPAQLSRLTSGQKSIDLDQLRAISTALGMTMAAALNGVV